MTFAQAGGDYSESTMLGRFGKPTHEENFGFGKELWFEKDGVDIIIDFLNDQACYVAFGTENHHEISENKQLAILQSNFPGLTWKEEPPLVGNSHPVTVWTSNSAWKATYGDGGLGIENPDLFALFEHKRREYYASHDDANFDKMVRDMMKQKPTP
jgi:hypothetical protein